MEDRHAMERTVAVRVATLVIVVGLLVGIGQGAFVEEATPAPNVSDEVALAASAVVPPMHANFDPTSAEVAQPIELF